LLRLSLFECEYMWDIEAFWTQAELTVASRITNQLKESVYICGREREVIPVQS
jgi:hypothetical protein